MREKLIETRTESPDSPLGSCGASFGKIGMDGQHVTSSPLCNSELQHLDLLHVLASFSKKFFQIPQSHTPRFDIGHPLIDGLLQGLELLRLGQKIIRRRLPDILRKKFERFSDFFCR